MNRFKIAGASVILLAAILVSLFPMASLAEESEELVAYYPFDGDYQDHSGNGNHATYQSGSFATGANSLGLSLNGDDEYVSVPVDINPSVMPQLTITLWALADNIDLYGTVISHDNYEWDRSICIDNRDGKTETDDLSWSAYCGLQTGVLASSPTPVTVSEWVFLAGIWDQDAGTVKLYVNNSVFEITGTCGAGLNYVYIGKNSTASYTYFNGIIDEVRIYNYALSQSEINNVRNSVSPPASVSPATTCDIVGEWQWFDGSTVYVSSNGTFEGGVPHDTGTWRATGSMTYDFTWSRSVDKLTISVDCQRLDGENQYGTTVWATRNSGQDNVGTITGTITDATTGQPLSGATIYIADTPEATTGSNGTYVLNNVPAGLAIVTASKSGYTSQNQSVDLIANTRATLDFALRRGYSPLATPGLTVSEAGLIAYYPFDGDTQDYSGSGNHATNNGASFVSGFNGQALNFDGTDDYVNSPVNINPSALRQMTITLWAQPNTIELYRTVISHDNGGFDRSISIDNRDGTTVMGDMSWAAYCGETYGVLGSAPVPATEGEWVFLAGVWDQDAGTVKLYVNDNVFEKTGTTGEGWDYVDIGRNPSSNASNFNGLIDEVRIYNNALSESQIETIREEGGTPGTSGVPTPTSTAPTSTPTTTAPTGPALTFESRTVIPGGTVTVPVRLVNVRDIGSLNFNVTYDSSVINIARVDRGSLLYGISFVVNPNETGIIQFGFATEDGVSGTGPIGQIVCNAVGSTGSSTPLTISGVEATDSSGSPVTLQTFSGSVTIASDRVIGDSNGDGVLTELDALVALRMSVNLIEEDLTLDMDQDERVTAKDSLAILSIAVRGR